MGGAARGKAGEIMRTDGPMGEFPGGFFRALLSGMSAFDPAKEYTDVKTVGVSSESSEDLKQLLAKKKDFAIHLDAIQLLKDEIELVQSRVGQREARLFDFSSLSELHAENHIVEIDAKAQTITLRKRKGK